MKKTFVQDNFFEWILCCDVRLELERTFGGKLHACCLSWRKVIQTKQEKVQGITCLVLVVDANVKKYENMNLTQK